MEFGGRGRWMMDRGRHEINKRQMEPGERWWWRQLQEGDKQEHYVAESVELQVTPGILGVENMVTKMSWMDA